MISLTPATIITNTNNKMSPARQLIISFTCLWSISQLPLITSAYQQLDELAAQQQSSMQAQAINHHNIPGHYEFEVAPKMEPPVVRRPPYPQSTQLCPGSADPFARFSPSHTLCGDLNQGRVPLNPLGQMIDDQSYPFELIKNKTLQFLARALPVLKLEYETIPKVARYLPANHLLNPTHQASPLVSDHLQRLNQRLSSSSSSGRMDASAALVDQLDQQMQQAPPIYLSRRRKRRSATGVGEQNSSPNPANNNNHSGVRVAAELMSNASIVVKSAHSGRIHSAPNWSSATNISSPAAVAAAAAVSAAVINAKERLQTTRHHQQLVAAAKFPSTQVGSSSATGSAAQKLQQTNTNHNGGISNWAPNSNDGQNAVAEASPTKQQPINDSSGGKSAQVVVGSQRPDATDVTSSSAPTSSLNAVNNNSDNRKQRNGNSLLSQSNRHLPGENQHATSSQADANGLHLTAAQDNKLDERSAATPSSSSADGSQSSVSGAASTNRPQSNRTTARRRMPSCSESANGITSAICQAAAALIEGDRPPVWLQLAKHLSAAYSGASNDSPLLPGPTLWSLLGGLASSGTSGSSVDKQQDNAKSSPASSVRQSAASSLMSVLGPLTTLLTGGPSAGSDQIQAKESSVTHRQDSSVQNNNKQQEQSLAQALGSSTMAKLAVAGWASNAIVSLVEYFAPSVYQSISSLAGGSGRSFAKRKKPFDPQEQFVDTPASMAANLKQQVSANGDSFAPGKQPPTPCPSVEEYISPTFARNYQGAWKYVVQIPHEGYFTQTIQRTSCVRQRCEFTEGVCHESPRWVSLLVAEIYYPNTIFGQSGATDPTAASSLANLQQQSQATGQQLATSSSTNSIQQVAMHTQPQQVAAAIMRQQQQQQPNKPDSLVGSGIAHDPLQMTDSQSTYNHNLQNAFINVANELGWDPTNVANMQHLANAYNYQLMQRSGLSSGVGQQSATMQQQQHQQRQQSPPLENRSSSATNFIQQQQQPTTSTFNNDYIMALAEATLQQNPSMSIQELIMSLRQQTQQLQQMGALTRKRRDANSVVSSQHQSALNRRQISTNGANSGSQQAQHRTSNAENTPSINDISMSSATLGPLGGTQFAVQSNKQQQVNPLQGSTPMQATMMAQHQAGPPPEGPAQVSAQNGMSADGTSAGQTSSMDSSAASSGNQVECDGYDKLGCYVVRVYYDWFLVNGSCKCWKTSGSNGQSGSQSGSAGSSGSTNSFLRRIFSTG